jgi:hypothetical protein
MTKTTISNVELFNRIRRLRREAEASYRAGRWQDAWVLDGEASRARLRLFRHPHDCSNCCRMERELPGGFIH